MAPDLLRTDVRGLIHYRREKSRRKIFFSRREKPIDNRAGILYNGIRSEEERKTLGPTADLRIFKLYA